MARNFVADSALDVAVWGAIHYNNVIQAWSSCEESDRYCRAEKVIQYLTILFGISRPAKLVGLLLKNVANSLWTRLQGRLLVEDDDDGWKDSIMGTFIFVLMEWILQPAWEWVGHASKCLKDEDNCEAEDRDDIIIFFMNMKIRYCESTEYDERQVSLDLDDDSIEDPNDWCTMIFNEGPLLFVTFIIWIVYVLSIAAVLRDDNGNGGAAAAAVNPPPPPPGNLPPANPPPANPPPPTANPAPAPPAIPPRFY